MKLAFLAGACALLVSLREKMEKFRTVLALVGLALIPIFLIMRQPDLGSAAVFLPMCFGLLFAGGTRLRYLLIPAGVGLAAAICSAVGKLSFIMSVTSVGLADGEAAGAGDWAKRCAAGTTNRRNTAAKRELG
jgi:cell division protein FtsW (lipid II flippase)